MKPTYEELESQLATAEAEVARLSELEKVWYEARTYHMNEVDKLRARLADLEEDQECYSKLNEDLRAEKEKLAAELAGAREEIKRLEAMNHDCAVALSAARASGSLCGEAMAREDAAVLRYENSKLRERLAQLTAPPRLPMATAPATDESQ